MNRSQFSQLPGAAWASADFMVRNGKQRGQELYILATITHARSIA